GCETAPPKIRMKSVLIFEMAHTGHHLRYVSLISQMFRSAGLEVILATSQTALQSSEYSSLMADCDPHIGKLVVPQMFKSGRRRDFEQVYRLWKLISKRQADLYFVPFLGTVYTQFGLFGILQRWLGADRPPIWGILLTWSFAYQNHTPFERPSWREKLLETN